MEKFASIRSTVRKREDFVERGSLESRYLEGERASREKRLTFDFRRNFAVALKLI